VNTHEMLAPMAICSHAWFFANAILSVVFVPYAVRDLGLNALTIGIAYAGAGVSAVLGNSLSGVVSRRLQVGGTDIAAYAVLAVAYLPVVPAVPGAAACRC
jgi:predicted MFS family arabinose efflux permease